MFGKRFVLVSEPPEDYSYHPTWMLLQEAFGEGPFKEKDAIRLLMGRGWYRELAENDLTLLSSAGYIKGV